MVGGDEDHFEVAREILQHMGKNVMHTGAVGTGQVMPIYLKSRDGKTEITSAS